MSITRLRTFVAVTKHGSFAEAAKHIGLTQAAVSQQMKALELEMGIELFERSGHSVRLNASARRLLAQAEDVIARYSALACSIRFDGPGGLLSIGGIPPTFAKLMPDALHDLRKHYPGIEVRITSGRSDELFTKVERGELDTAVISESPVPLGRGLVWHALTREPLVLISGPAVKAASLRDVFSREPFIRVNRQSWTGRLIDHTLRRAKLAFKDIMELDSIDAIVEMVGRSLGVAIIPFYDGAWRSNRKLNSWLIDQPRIYRTIGLLEREAHSKVAITEALLRSLRRVVSQPKLSHMRTIRVM